MTVRLVMDEWTADNLAMALLGDTSVNTDGDTVVDIFSRNAFEGELKIRGHQPRSAAMGHSAFQGRVSSRQVAQPISDEWGNIEIEGRL